MDTQISILPTSDLQEAEQQLKNATSALENAQLATRAADSVLRERRAEESEARAAYDRATGRIKEVYAEERRRLEEAARTADAALKQLEGKLRSLKPGDSPPSPRRPEAPPEPALPAEPASLEEPAPPAETDAVDLTSIHESNAAEDWLAQLQEESERERGAPGDA
jgi:chromosome segregation ATPase